MQNPKSVSELLAGAGKKLSALKARALDRTVVLEQVRAALPARLAEAVASAGLDQGRLTIGVDGAAWASRLRYLTEPLRKSVSEASGTAIVSVRVRVVPPPPAAPKP
jgi:hypothetical protein